MARPRTFCSDVSLANAEPLGATASRIDHFLLVEYRGLWARDELGESRLPEPVKEHLRAQVARLPHSRLLFVRRPERRGHTGHAVYFARTTEDGPLLQGLEVESYDDLLGIDAAGGLLGEAPLAGAPLEHPLLVVCTHGKRDPCCARKGRPLYEGLREEADDGWVWQATHVGGDRFAGNVVCLPDGLYFGRVTRLDAVGVLADYLAGQIRLESYRGRCCYGFAVQAAELAVREATGLRGIADLRFERRVATGDGRWRVTFRARGGEAYEVDVAVELGDLVELTCAAAIPKRPRRYVARGVESPPARAS